MLAHADIVTAAASTGSKARRKDGFMASRYCTDPRPWSQSLRSRPCSRGGGRGAAAPKAPSRANAVEHIKVHGKSLEGNLEGDSPDRDVAVYLPPSYATDQARRFPVVYLLHGYGGRDDTFTGRLAKLPEQRRQARRPPRASAS